MFVKILILIHFAAALYVIIIARPKWASGFLGMLLTTLMMPYALYTFFYVGYFLITSMFTELVGGDPDVLVNGIPRNTGSVPYFFGALFWILIGGFLLFSMYGFSIALLMHEPGKRLWEDFSNDPLSGMDD